MIEIISPGFEIFFRALSELLAPGRQSPSNAVP